VQNKRKGTNQNRNSAYYKSRVRKNNRNKFSFYDTAKKRQMNSYFRAIAVLLVFMGAVSGVIFLGIVLKNLVENESGLENNAIADTSGISGIDNFSEIDLTNGDTEEAVDIPQIYYKYHGVYLDITKITNLEDLEKFIAAIKENGINAVNIDIKCEDGIIPFEIDNPAAVLVGAVNSNENLKIEEIIDMLHENNLYVSGTVACFKDDLATMTYPNYSLLKKSDGLIWRDTYGSHWLNAYSEGARDYIREIIAASVKLNFDEIILSYFFFPNLANPNEVQYGGDALSKYDAVKEFIKDVRGDIKENAPHIKLGLNIPLRYFLQVPHDITGINPNSIVEAGLCDFVVTSFAPSEIPTTISIGGTVMKNAAQNPYDSVKKLCEHFEDYISRIMFRPILQAYDSPEGIKFDSENRRAQKQALYESDIKVWQLLTLDNIYY